MIVGKAAVSQILHEAGVNIPKPPAAPGSGKGRHILATWRRNPKLIPAVYAAVARHIGAEWEIGHGGVERFMEHVMTALQLLRKEKVTATALLGQVLELIFPDLKEVRKILGFADHTMLRIANTSVDGSHADFIDSKGQSIVVTSRFTTKTTVRDAWIRLPGQEKGKKYFDHGCLLGNKPGQILPVGHEFKAKKAGLRGMRKQITRMMERILEAGAVQGAELTYWAVDPKTGKETFRVVPLSQVVLVPNKGGPFSRIAVRADEKGFRVKVSKDLNNRPYLDVSAVIHSDGIRRALQMLLADKSWQQPGWSTR